MPKNTKKTQVIDKTVGNNIQSLRATLGLSRQQLADKIGVTHQQLQKYEQGINRMSVGRLVLIAEALKEPLSYFVGDVIADHSVHRKLVIQVSRNFAQIKNKAVQEAIAHLIKTMIKEK